MKNVIVSILLITLSTVPANAGFEGNLKLIPDGCKKQSYCFLEEEFGFIDQNNKGWLVKKNSKTDGASIPRWAQMFVGIPYRPEYVKAAVIHDYYSKGVRPVNKWAETQYMFYETLRASGVSRTRATVLYAGVLIGSGKWVSPKAGTKCNLGDNCVQLAEPETNTLKSYMYIDEQYGQSRYLKDFNQIKEIIEADENFNLKEIEEMAISKRLKADEI